VNASISPSVDWVNRLAHSPSTSVNNQPISVSQMQQRTIDSKFVSSHLESTNACRSVLPFSCWHRLLISLSFYWKKKLSRSVKALNEKRSSGSVLPWFVIRRIKCQFQPSIVSRSSSRLLFAMDRACNDVLNTTTSSLSKSNERGWAIQMRSSNQHVNNSPVIINEISAWQERFLESAWEFDCYRHTKLTRF
jgi:hypothetical protein